jgi:flagellar biosynthesis protein FlhB
VIKSVSGFEGRLRLSCRNMKGDESRFVFDIQWFAAEDEGRTEEPTEQKIRKAREEGKVAKSSELTSALVLLFPVVMIGILAPFIFQQMAEMLRYFFSSSAEIDVTSQSTIVPVFYSYFIKLVLPIAAIAFIAAIMGNVFQVGFLFTVKPITPDLTKIIPRFGRFFRKSLFSGEALFNLAKSILKIAIIAFVAFLNIRNDYPKLAHLVSTPFLLGVRTIASVAFRILVEAAIAMLLISLPDYLFQRRLHIESLKMSKQEVKEERKQAEGDPMVRSRLRERMRDLMTRNMLQTVPRADVVITNPTHFAVAMEWKRERMPAPMVVAKGQDHIAARIREIATEHNIPLIENKPLARALFQEVEIGDVIPEQYYEVMAVILAQVYRMTGKAV